LFSSPNDKVVMDALERLLARLFLCFSQQQQHTLCQSLIRSCMILEDKAYLVLHLPHNILSSPSFTTIISDVLGHYLADAKQCLDSTTQLTPQLETCVCILSKAIEAQRQPSGQEQKWILDALSVSASILQKLSTQTPAANNAELFNSLILIITVLRNKYNSWQFLDILNSCCRILENTSTSSTPNTSTNFSQSPKLAIARLLGQCGNVVISQEVQSQCSQKFHILFNALLSDKDFVVTNESFQSYVNFISDTSFDWKLEYEPDIIAFLERTPFPSAGANLTAINELEILQKQAKFLVKIWQNSEPKRGIKTNGDDNLIQVVRNSIDSTLSALNSFQTRSSINPQIQGQIVATQTQLKRLYTLLSNIPRG